MIIFVCVCVCEQGIEKLIYRTCVYLTNPIFSIYAYNFYICHTYKYLALFPLLKCPFTVSTRI